MDQSERTIALLEELVAWTKVLARDSITPLLRTVLSDPKHFRVYDLTDGSRSQQEIGEAVGLSQPAVSRMYQKWRKLGLLRESNGRVVHLVKPSDIGLEEPTNGSLRVQTGRSKQSANGGSDEPIS
jgi:hypothetical protein